jgi:hypothetical protein
MRQEIDRPEHRRSARGDKAARDDARRQDAPEERGEISMAANDLSSRVDAMFTRDKIWAYGFVVVLWATLIFVYTSLAPIIPDTGVHVVILIAGIVVGLFNTISIVAMIAHYSHDRKFIYELDIRHLDESRGGTLMAAHDAPR